METKSNTRLRLWVAIGVAVAAFILLSCLGAEADAKKILTHALTGMLTGALAFIVAVIIPHESKPVAQTEDPGQKPDTPLDTSSGTTQISQEEYDEAYRAYKAWKVWGENADRQRIEFHEMNAVLDTKQTVLRIRLFAMLAFGFISGTCGFLAPKLGSDTAHIHIAWLAGGYSLVALVLGVAVQLVGVRTSARDARRSAFLAAAVLNLGSFMLTLPYAFAPLWEKQVQWDGFHQPLLIVMLLARVVALPMLAYLTAWIGFGFSHFAFPHRTPGNVIAP